jgi:hypothetical protein
VANDVPETR